VTDTRNQSDADELKLTIDRLIARARTAIPARVDAFDAATQLVTASPLIRKIQTIDGVKTTVNVAQVVQVPLLIPYAQTAGFALTLPIQAGDTVLLVVADRSIDNWREFGGVQDPVETTVARHHDLTDSLAIVGCTPDPQALSGYLTNGIEIRNSDRSVRASLFADRVELVAGTSQIVINNDGTITMTAPGDVTITGNVSVTGTITATGEITGNGVALSTHTHGGVTTGAGNTGAPN